MTLLLVSIVWLAINVALTQLIKPQLFHTAEFWLLQVDPHTSYTYTSEHVKGIKKYLAFRFERHCPNTQSKSLVTN